MAINFIPNDPQAGQSAPGIRSQKKRPNRPSKRAGFTFSNAKPEGAFDPGTPGFLFWQCREAALAALETWEASTGQFKRWQGNRKKLPLRQDVGVELNAFYDRASVSFFHHQAGDKTFFSGESTDVVSHEVGHGILDAIRPDLWDVPFLEAGAFHEAFADCIAILTALNDQATRQSLLAVTKTLRKRNFVETTAEDLSEGIRRLFPKSNAAEPRHAFNTLQFQIPETLPDDGGPGTLINEVHSFARLFTGSFYDLIAEIFGGMGTPSPANLEESGHVAARLLLEAVKAATVTPRFLQSVGRAMVLADEQINKGEHRDDIRRAFQNYGILLGANAMVAPSTALAGSAPGARPALATATRKDLRRRLGASPASKLLLAAAKLFGRNVVRATHRQEVPLGSVDRKLKGVVAEADVHVLVGASGGRAAIFGGLPETVATETEVHAFVRSLLAHDRIAFKTDEKAARRSPTPSGPTHEIKMIGGKKRLVRRRFQCDT